MLDTVHILHSDHILLPTFLVMWVPRYWVLWQVHQVKWQPCIWLHESESMARPTAASRAPLSTVLLLEACLQLQVCAAVFLQPPGPIYAFCMSGARPATATALHCACERSRVGQSRSLEHNTRDLASRSEKHRVYVTSWSDPAPCSLNLT